MGQPQDRKWTVDLRARDPEGNPFYDEDYAAQATAQAYMDLATIQHREGGAFVVAPIRTQIPAAPDALTPDPVWVNMGLVVEHKFVPPVRQRPAPHIPGDGRPHILMGGDAGQAVSVTQDSANGVPEMRDEDEATAAAELAEGDEPSAVMAQPSDPLGDVDAEHSRMQPEPLDPARLIPEMR